jgi:leucyl aminopeptidase
MPAAAARTNTCAVEYGGEKDETTNRTTKKNAKASSSSSWCDIVLVQDPDRLEAALEAVGLDDRSIGVKVVLPGGARKVVCWFDASRPATASAQVAEVAAAMRRDGERVRLLLGGVQVAFRGRIVLAVAKAAYEGYASRRADAKEEARSRHRIAFVGAGSPEAGRELQRLAEGAAMAADIENAPANEVGPKELARAVVAWQPRTAQVRCRVIEAAELAKLGMGLVLGVGAGATAARAPRLVLLELRGAGGGKKDKKKTTVALVGKGVVYDTGGLAIKTLNGMLGMHADKSGAAVAAAVFRHFALNPSTPFDAVAVLPCVENAISATAVRPGDVLTACDGTTVEVVNPDAEGRLILADALAFAGRAFEPDHAFDFATMTNIGATMHPDVTAAIYAEGDAHAAAAMEAGEACGERVWRLPPWSEYGYDTDSQVADARNSGWGSVADGYMAALFLRRFVPEAIRDRWVHVDIVKNESRGTSLGGGGSGPFVGAGVALGVGIVARTAGRG